MGYTVFLITVGSILCFELNAERVQWVNERFEGGYATGTVVYEFQLPEKGEFKVIQLDPGLKFHLEHKIHGNTHIVTDHPAWKIVKSKQDITIIDE